MSMKHIMIELEAIVMDETTQCRVALKEKVIAEYSERMSAGDTFPPVDIFGTRDECWIGDGWHRIAAARRNGSTMIEANLYPGGRTEAVEFAGRANDRHGVRRTNADRRKAVEAIFALFPTLSNVQLATKCLVSEGLVRKMESEGRIVRTCDERVGLDGKTYPSSPARQRKESGGAATSSHVPEDGIEPAEQPTGMHPSSAGQREGDRYSDRKTRTTNPRSPKGGLDAATLTECHAVLDAASVECAANRVKELLELMEAECRNQHPLPDQLSQVPAIIGEHSNDGDDKQDWSLLLRVCKAIERRTDGYIEESAWDVYDIVDNAVHVEKPVFRELKEKFIALEKRVSQDSNAEKDDMVA